MAVSAGPAFVNFISNLLWFNIRKIKVNILWRVLLTAINFMVLFSSFLVVEFSVLLFIFIIGSLANVLFINIRTGGKAGPISLLRSIGASYLFIIIDNLLEVLVEFFAACLIYLAVLPFFYKTVHHILLILASSLALFLMVSPLFSLSMIGRVEKQRKKM